MIIAIVVLCSQITITMSTTIVFRQPSYLEEVSEYFRAGCLVEHENDFIDLTEGHAVYEINTVYSPKVFAAHLTMVTEIYDIDCITSTVARCVERGMKVQLEMLMSHLDRLVSLSKSKYPLEKRLMLRKCDSECYHIARRYGFIDDELEKRLILIQRKWRKQPANSLSYTGPTVLEYIPSGDNNPCDRYWGYRQTLYILKWNRTQRYHILKLIQKHWWGDCRYQAYVDYLEPKTEDNISHEWSNKEFQ